LANEWPDEDDEFRKPKKKKNTKAAEDSFIVDDEANDETVAKKKKRYGPLMDINWYRVVLDEAQNIRNARTRISSAVTHIIAEIR
jgi:SNF2 family DNA or RNA helicase